MSRAMGKEPLALPDMTSHHAPPSSSLNLLLAAASSGLPISTLLHLITSGSFDVPFPRSVGSGQSNTAVLRCQK